MADDHRYKPKPDEIDLVAQAEFERDVAILFQVPPAEADTIEATRLRRPPPKQKKKAS